MFNKDMIVRKYGDFVIEDKCVLGGVQLLFRFQNGYGASLVSHMGSYGNEIAVIEFQEDGNWKISYDTNITEDVLGHLDDEEIIETLGKIQNIIVVSNQCKSEVI